MPNTSDVGANYEAFMRQQLRAIAVGMGITYEQLTGDLTNVNYSSIRAGLIEFRRRCATLQHHVMVFHFADLFGIAGLNWLYSQVPYLLKTKIHRSKTSNGYPKVLTGLIRLKISKYNKWQYVMALKAAAK